MNTLNRNRDTDIDPFEAIALGEVSSLNSYFSAGGDINIRDQEGRSLLQCSLLEDQYNDEIAAYLIENGIDLSGITHSNSMGEDDSEYLNASVLHLAYLNGGSRSVAFELLIDNPAVDLNSVCEDGNNEWFAEEVYTREHIPCSYTDSDSFENATILHYAVLNQDVDAVAKILSYPDRINVNAESYRVHNKELSKHRDWLQQNEINAADDYQEYGLIWAAREAVEVFCIKKITPLHLACELKNSEIISMLLDAGADPEYLDGKGESPFKYLVYFKEISEKYGEEKQVEAIQELISLLENVKLGNKQYKTRLFLGEADFSYSVALLEKHKSKHPDLGKYIIATEYLPRGDLYCTYGTGFLNNEACLLGKDVTMLFNVDATQLHLDERFCGKIFPRIHFNFPHDKSNFKERSLPKMIDGFFKSASHCQKVGDRIYIALPKPATESKKNFYQGFVYGLYDASINNHYCLTQKRLFGGRRYSGYAHKITNSNQSAPVSESAREYIFIKTELPCEEIIAKLPPKIGSAYSERYQFFSKEPETDSDSSDYEILPVSTEHQGPGS